MSCRRATSQRSCSTTAVRGERLRVEMEGVATSAILSASWGRASRDMSPAETKTTLTGRGRRWRKLAQEHVIQVGTSSISQQLLHPVQKLRWFLVPEFLCSEELLQTALVRSRDTLDQLCLEGVVWWSEEEVPNLGH